MDLWVSCFVVSILIMFPIYIVLQLDDNAEFFFSIYRLQLALAIVALFVNLLICTYAFSGDAFSPHTAMFRTLLVIDVFSNLGYVLDAFAALLHRK